jgi:tetratricopeptide (TPR) repeat protein
MFLLLNSNVEVSRRRLSVARITYAVLALLCPLVAVCGALIAGAELLRNDPTPENIAKAIRFDRINQYAYTLKAEHSEQAGRFNQAEQGWREALRYDRRNAEAWIRLGLLAEHGGNASGAEACLLRGEAVSRTWVPRMALVNFYLRQGRTCEARRWARHALDRASSDVAALFSVLDAAGLDVESLLPANRPVLASYINYRLQTSRVTAPNTAAMRLATLIPNGPATWPGAASPLNFPRVYPSGPDERASLLSVIDRLLTDGAVQHAVRLWNEMASRRIVSAGPWTSASPLINPEFRSEPSDGGLDWRRNAVTGASVLVFPGEAAVHLNGKQPESVDLLSQRIYLPAGMRYRWTIESRTDGLSDHNGVQWQIRNATGAELYTSNVPPSDEWIRSASYVSSAPSDRLLQVTLAIRRVPGHVRAEGAIHFRRVALELVP